MAASAARTLAAANPGYLWAACRALAAEAPSEKLVGVVQTASATKVVSLPLVLFMMTNHSSGDDPVVVPIAEDLMLTAVLVDGLYPPPPVTTIPAGQTTNAPCSVPVGKAVYQRHAGEEVDVEAPSGTFRVRIEAIRSP